MSASSRPSVSPLENSRVWWKYVCMRVINENKSLSLDEDTAERNNKDNNDNASCEILMPSNDSLKNEDDYSESGLDSTGGHMVGELESIEMVGLHVQSRSLVEGIYMPTTQQAFSMPVYYRLDDRYKLTSTKLSIAHIDRHEYGWAIKGANNVVLAKAVYSGQSLLSGRDPFTLPQNVSVSSMPWKVLTSLGPSGVGSYSTEVEAHFEVCSSSKLAELQLKRADSSMPYGSSNRETFQPRPPDSDDEEEEEKEKKSLFGDSDDEVDEWEGGERSGLSEHSSRVLLQGRALSLGQVNSTRDKIDFSLQAEQQKRIRLRVRPSWPDWLGDLSFDVVKINRFGRQQKRELKLTKNYILNVKNGSDVSRLHPYGDISRVQLVGSTKFVLEFVDKDTDRPLEYESEVAAHIVQQVSTRVKVGNALREVCPQALVSSSAWRDSSPRIKKNSTVELVSSEKLDRDSNVLDFIRSLGSSATSCFDSSCVVITASSLDSRDQEEEYLRVLAMSPDSRAHVVRQAVDDIISSKVSSEGLTTLQFTNNFMENVKEITNSDLTGLRHFIDGMHSYLLRQRVFQLAALLLNESEQALRPVCRLEETYAAVLSYIVFAAVEEALSARLLARICSLYLANPTSTQQELQICLKMKSLCRRHQEEWGVADSHQSPAGWNSAIFELAGVERNHSLSMRLQALVYAAKAIYSEFKCEVLPLIRAKKGSEFSNNDAILGADDFLPIFIFVVCKAGLKHPHFNKNILWNGCHPDQLRGESGYYLTMYESAIEYILAVDCTEQTSHKVVLHKSSNIS